LAIDLYNPRVQINHQWHAMCEGCFIFHFASSSPDVARPIYHPVCTKMAVELNNHFTVPMCYCYQILTRLFLQEADKAYFTVEEFEIANQLSGDTDPSQWLKTVWNSLVDTVISSVNVDLKSIEPAAQLSKEEARLALIQASGDANRASGMASATWKQQV